MPRGVDGTLYPRLIHVCRRLGKPVLLDTSGELLVRGVAAHPTLIKPNADEMRQLLGDVPALSDVGGVAQAAWKIHVSGVPYVAVSLGGEGCVFACDEGIFRAIPPRITPVNTAGCGDSMIAGFAMGLAHGWDVPRILTFATAMAAANALELGTGCVDPARVTGLIDGVLIER